MRNIDKFAANELGHQGVTAERFLKTVSLIAEFRLLTAIFISSSLANGV